jgi:hypothetical protein
VAESIDLRRAVWDRWRWLAATAGGLVLGGLAYPERFRLLLLPTEQFGDEQARQAVRLYREWQPAGFDSPLGWVFAIVGLLALYGALRGGRPGAGSAPGDLPGEPASPVPSTHEPSGSDRVTEPSGAGVAVVVHAPPEAVGALATTTVGAPAAARRPGADGSARSSSPTRWGSVAAVVVLTAMGLGATRLLPIAAITLAAFAASGIEQVSTIAVAGRVPRRFMVGLGAVLGLVALVQVTRPPHLDLEPYPVEEVDWLERRGLVAVPDVTVVSPDFVGNYLELRYGDQANAWVDDRPSVDTFLDYDRLQHLSEGWQESLAEADPDVVLWERDEPLAAELRRDPSWQVGLTTDRYLVLCRAATVGSRCG